MGVEKKSLKKKLLIFIIVVIGVIVGGFCIYFYLPYGDSGVKAGQLNYVVHKGVVFKTYEGKLILTGIKSGATGGVQSNEFEFSIEDKDVAEKLMKLAGRNVMLHYKEYFGALPWRGYSKFIVDSIVEIDSVIDTQPIDPGSLVEN